MKETYYFAHDYNPTSDPKIQALIGEHGAAGYGIYWRIVEMLHEDDSHELELKPYMYIALAKQLSTSVEQVRTLVEQCVNVYELFETDGVIFWSERVKRNIEKRNEISNKRSKAGKISAENRKNATHVEHMSTHVEHIPTKEIKGKEIKGNKEDNIKAFSFKKSLLDLGVEDSIANDWIKVRQAKKAANTETAFNAIRTQIELSGISANECVKIAAEKSWQGLKAEWIKNELNDMPNGNKTYTGNTKNLHANDPIFCGVER